MLKHIYNDVVAERSVPLWPKLTVHVGYTRMQEKERGYLLSTFQIREYVLLEVCLLYVCVATEKVVVGTYIVINTH